MSFPTDWPRAPCDLLPHLLRDSRLGETIACWIYGQEDDASELLPRHRRLLQSYVGDALVNECTQANGTKQLRISRAPFRRFLQALGVERKHSHEKRVPWSLFQAPAEAQVGFLRGLFGADGCVVNQDSNGTRYAGLASRSYGLLQDVQK